MIRYALRCSRGHDFDGWFRSSDGFQAMLDAGQVTCSACGDADVRKALMAPSVAEKKSQPDPTPLEKLRQHVEANSDYVGPASPRRRAPCMRGPAPAAPSTERPAPKRRRS